MRGLITFLILICLIFTISASVFAADTGFSSRREIKEFCQAVVTYVKDGKSSDVAIEVDPAPATGDMYIVMLHRDVNENQVFDEHGKTSSLGKEVIAPTADGAASSR